MNGNDIFLVHNDSNFCIMVLLVQMIDACLDFMDANVTTTYMHYPGRTKASVGISHTEYILYMKVEH